MKRIVGLLAVLLLLALPGASAQEFNLTHTVLIDAIIAGGPFAPFAGASQRPLQRHLIHANSLWWDFYYDDVADEIRYETSTDAEVWIDRGAIITGLSDGLDGSRGFDVIYDSATDQLHYVYARPTAGFNMRYRTGTPNSNSTISWLAAEQTIDTAEVAQPSIAIDGNGRVHVGYFRAERFTIIGNANTDGTWSTDYLSELSRGTVVLKGTREGYGSLHSLTNGQILAIWGMESAYSAGGDAENHLAWTLGSPASNLGAYGWTFPRAFIPVEGDVDLFSPTWMHINAPRLQGTTQEAITVYHLRDTTGSQPELFWLTWQANSGWGCAGCQEREIPVDEDSYVNQADPNGNFGSASTLHLRTEDSAVTGGDFAKRFFLQWDLSSIPTGAAIENATFSYGPPAGVTNEIANLTAVETSWSNASITWNSQPGVNASSEIVFNIRPSLAEGFTTIQDRFSVGITDIVQQWVDGQRPNHGIRIHTFSGIDSTWQLPSEESTSQARTNARPHLTVRWTDPAAVLSDTELDSPNATVGASGLLGGIVHWPNEDLSFTSINITVGGRVMYYFQLRGTTWFGGNEPIKEVTTDMRGSTALRESRNGNHYTLYTSASVSLEILMIDANLEETQPFNPGAFATDFGPAWVGLLAAIGFISYIVYRFKRSWDKRGGNRRVKRGQWWKRGA